MNVNFSLSRFACKNFVGICDKFYGWSKRPACELKASVCAKTCVRVMAALVLP